MNKHERKQRKYKIAYPYEFYMIVIELQNYNCIKIIAK